MQKVYKKILNVTDAITGGGLQSVKKWFGDSNIGNKTNNFLDMEEDLPKLLKHFEKLTKKMDNVDTDAGRKAFEAEAKLFEMQWEQ